MSLHRHILSNCRSNWSIGKRLALSFGLRLCPVRLSYQVSQTPNLSCRGLRTRVDPGGFPCAPVSLLSPTASLIAVRASLLAPSLTMNEFADAVMQNLPELLARDLAEQQDVFLAKGISSSGRTPAGFPSAGDLAYYETQVHSPPPSLPQRNPSRVLHRFHQQVGPETFLCSLKQNSVERAWRTEREAILKNAAVCHSRHSSHSRAPRWNYQHHHHHHVPSPRIRNHCNKCAHMKQETDQDATRLFLNGMDEDWGSDSSADVERGMSSPSVRTRKQSITTAATSVDFQLSSGEKEMDGCSTEPFLVEGHCTGDDGQSGEGHRTDGFHSDGHSPGRSPEGSIVDNSEKEAAWQAWNDGGSWFDLGEHEVQVGEKRRCADPRRYGRRIELSQDARDGGMPHHQYFPHNGDLPHTHGGELSHCQSSNLSHTPGNTASHAQSVIASQGQNGNSSHTPRFAPSHIQSGLPSHRRRVELLYIPGAAPSHVQNGLPSHGLWGNSSHIPGATSSHIQSPFSSQLQGDGSSHQAGDNEPALFLSSQPCDLGSVHQAGGAEGPLFTMEDNNNNEDDSTTDTKLALLVPPVPKRRSSLSHQVTTLAMGETAPPSLKHAPHSFPQQSSLPSPPTSLHHLPFQHHSPRDWDEAEAAVGPIVPTGRHQTHKNLQLDLSTVSPDELSLPPLSVTESRHHDRPHHDRTFSLRSQHQQPNLLSKPRKSHSITKMPLRNVHHWLESSNRARQHSPSASMASPVSISPTSSVRVSGHVLESLISSVQNFPATMLQLSSVPIESIRDYSNKVKRSDTARQLLPARENSEPSTVIPHSPSSPTSPTLGRKTSFNNFKTSIRGKFSRLTNTSNSPSIYEQGEADWPPIDDSTTTAVQCDLAPLTPGAARDAACTNALRGVLPNGSPYILDGLYAHIIAYNYINSFCSAVPDIKQHSESPHLRTRPSKNVVFPAGVTSLADLRVQEDVSDTVVQDFQDEVASVTSKSVVPSKAASLLGLGSTDTGKLTKPGQGGREDNKLRKTSPPGGAYRGGHYLASDSALRSLRDDLALNIKCLVDTAESGSFVETVGEADETQDSNIVRHNGSKQLDPLLLRAFSEIVRCYEELSC